ncbi:hypothetical protein Asppvi_005822 [Aspergillus pseudoviridinutans]|uniref:Uncharacterized protein n=1 Tax=Aspergillus pseudoviridinutans TaxID=1517512 RepID=A0A9P3BFE7_9EURO|nr:uncharacterized protein Asppvi_005822 [Aspergillus pseudoviridinutans]GIJ86924.1 hypothetical protein Asppvi_005822 [Aspergillus pseudoviridinutans]
MGRLLELPVEVLLIVYGSLETINDAVIDNNLPLPKSPDTTWLRDHFAPDWCWKPTESQVPDNLVDKRTREFLTTSGIPSGICPITQWNSSLLRDFENADAERYAWDADLIIGRRLEDDHSAPVNFCYCIGQLDLALAMLDAKDGTVFHFDQGAYGKYANRGIIADSVPSLLVLLGTVEASVARMGKMPSNLSRLAFEKDNDMRLFVLAALRKIMSEYDDRVEQDSMFWNAIFHTCVEY